MENGRSHKGIKIAAAFVAAAFVVITVGANISPASATTMENVSVISSPVRVFTFREHTMDDGTYRANIKIPAVKSLESNKPLKSSLNQKYMEESGKLYKQFGAKAVELKKSNDGHPGVNSGYEVKCDDDAILSIGRYVVNTVGFSSTTMKYDIIDKKNQVLTTLPGLFKDKQYVEATSKSIRQQMVDQSKADPDKIYWVEGIDAGEDIELF